METESWFQIILSYLLLHNFEKGNKEIHVYHMLLELLLQKWTLTEMIFSRGPPQHIIVCVIETTLALLPAAFSVFTVYACLLVQRGLLSHSGEST